MRLSKKDIKLIFELDLNYRQPKSRIAKKIKMSQQLLNYKAKSLSTSGIIQSSYPLIDYSRFGLLGFRVYFKVNYHNRKTFKEMVNKIKTNDNVLSIMECEGSYDLMITFSTKNPSSFNKSLRELISENPKHLKNCMILTTVVEHHFPRNYLIGSKLSQDIVIGGDRDLIEIDEKNKKILQALSLGKKTIIDIAGFTKTTPKTIITRLRNLESQEIIKSYKTLIDTEKIGISANKILIKYQNISIERENQLRAFCIQNPNITEFIKTFGEWDLELTLETKTKKDFRNIYITLRELFEDIIYDFQSFTVFKTHKKTTLPESFFD